MDAAQIVVYRSQYQKRTVDEILTVSKLDSGLFSIILVEVQPVAMIEQLLKALEDELHAAGMSRQFHVEGLFIALAVKWVSSNTSPVLQILITLIMNAIKFTQFAERHQHGCVHREAYEQHAGLRTSAPPETSQRPR